jgi:hypothetical protein
MVALQLNHVEEMKCKMYSGSRHCQPHHFDPICTAAHKERLVPCFTTSEGGPYWHANTGKSINEAHKKSWVALINLVHISILLVHHSWYLHTEKVERYEVLSEQPLK